MRGTGPERRDSYDVIVVGGGFAGVCAARDLCDAGRQVLILEARDRLGGRTFARQFPSTEHHVELGGSWLVPSKQPSITAEMSRYGLRLAGTHAKDETFAWRFGGEVSTGFPLDSAERYELERALFRLMKAARRVDLDRPGDLRGLGELDVSVDDFLRGCDISRRTYEFLSAFGSLGSGAASPDWSALTAVSLIAAFDGSALAWYSAVDETLRGGPGTMLRAMAEDGAPDIELSAAVARIEQSEDRIRVTLVDNRQFEAASAIVTLPVNVWADVEFSPPLSDAKAAMASEQQPNRMLKVWLLVENAPSHTQGFGFGNDFVLLAPHYQVGDARLMVGFAPPPTLVDLSARATIEAAVQQYFPDATVLATDGHDWNADPFSKGGWLTHRPGQLSSYMPGIQQSEGRLFFAGSDVALRWVGWIDGALSTAAAAAAQALDLLTQERA